MTARTTATPAAITLTRAEAVTVDSLLLYTNDAFPIDGDTSTPEGVEAVVRRLRLEAVIREAGGWWDHGKPGMLDMYEQSGRGTCPDVFTLPADAARALAELLPIAFADALDGDAERTVVAVAARLGVEIPQEVTE